MPDRDEVIKDAEHAIAMLGDLEEPTPECDFIRVSFENTLALLREPVEPDHIFTNPVCGVCHGPLDVTDDYCRSCGRAVKWNG